MEKETLEEIVEKMFPFTDDDSENRIITIKRLYWIDGAKWQQQRMYSEEEVLKLLITFSDDRTFLKKEVAIQWFEQNKK